MATVETGSPMVMTDGFGGGGFIWAFLIFALLMGNGGFGFGGGNGNSNAIQADVNRGFDNQNLQAQTRDILTANNFSDKYSELARDVAGVNTSVQQAIANQNECCCSTKLLLSESFGQARYDNAMNTASINATTTAQTQKILDVLAQNKIESLQNRVNQLEMQNSLAGVVKYPMSSVYSAGGSPFCNNCGCNGYPLYN